MRDGVSHNSGAEECILKAIAVAKGQNAKSLELRATLSLARFWAEQDRETDARNVLESVYAWFTEGFQTADLKQAKQFLDKLR